MFRRGLLSGCLAAVTFLVSAGCTGAPRASTIGTPRWQRPAAEATHVRVVVPVVPRTSNLVCPITGLPVVSGTPTVAHGDLTIGFCSRECPVVWSLMSDAEKDHLLKQSERNRKHVRRRVR